VRRRSFRVRGEALLIASSDSPETGNLAKVLCFFGVTSRGLSAGEFLEDDSYGSSEKIRLVCSSDSFWELITKSEQQPEEMRRWPECVHSVFVHAGDDVAVLQSLLRKLTGNNAAAVTALEGGCKEFLVADMADFCGPMSDLRITASDATG